MHTLDMGLMVFVGNMVRSVHVSGGLCILWAWGWGTGVDMEMDMDMEIRKATIEDAAAIARNVLAAMEYDVYVPSADGAGLSQGVRAGDGAVVYPVEALSGENRKMLEGMTEICRREDTLYSWRNTLVAVAPDCDCGSGVAAGGSGGGVIAGSLTSYDGADYLAMRELTFALAREKFGWEPPVMDDETRAGEWYMDSLAVHPSFRGKGLAQLLFSQAFEVAEALGFTRASLIALASADRLVAHYESFGFRPEGHLNCFGHDYLRMVADI